MKANKKALALVLCALMLVATSVFGTLAYLTDDTEVVTNTFTIGNVTIDLDETDVDVYGVKDGDTRVKANQYKLIPGHQYVKDPIVHVNAGSEECYVFVEITNEIADIEADTKIADQMKTNGWTLVSGETNVYAYNTTVDAREAAKDLKVFDTFKVDGTKENTDLTAYGDKTITVKAYAIQKDGFSDAVSAWAALDAQLDSNT